MADGVTALAEKVIGRPLSTPREELLRALDPVHFVNIRVSPGGPARDTVLQAIAEVEREAAEDQRWIEEKSLRLDGYRARLKDSRRAWLMAQTS